MAVSFFGDFDTTETVVIPFNTFDSNDPAGSVTVTNLANTDVHIHKNGSLTQRSSSAGVTVDIDVDGITGCHWVTIDLSDDTDSGFYANGSQISVRVEGITVDAGTLNPWIGAFTIGRTLRPATDGRKIEVSAAGAVNSADLVIASGTIGSTGNDTTHLHLDGLTHGNDGLNNCLIRFYDDSTGLYYSRWITDWVLSTELATLNEALPVTPENATDTYVVLAPRYDMTSSVLEDHIDNRLDLYFGSFTNYGSGANAAGNFDDLQILIDAVLDDTTEIGVAGAGLTNINLPNQTMDITGNITGNLSGSVGSVTGAVGSVTGNVGGNVTGTVGGLATQAKADVNAEVVDALATDTYAEPGQGAPAATTSLAAKINYIYKSWRNKKDNDGATTQLYADDGTTVDQKQTTSESGGTVTKGEWVTGP